MKLNMWHPRWNDQSLMLKHNLRDDRMIGVLPDREWRESEDIPKFRIIGKGNKIRLIHLKRGWLKRVEKYADTDRLNRIARRKDSNRPANLLIDRDGKPLTPGALYKAFVRANRKINAPFEITPHVLRHIFACRFLQVAIEVEARRAGLEIDDLTRRQIEDYAELPLESLALELGHASVETTRIYVEMLITSWLAPRYHNAWNSVLDAVE
ncbi:tyrosine-type recombinase/integrase [Ferirhizobium litorale]|uniref:Tyrosine-type recombinase/integrase n=1 Tax=Ferirhizobium litorale TaxID=2927786 RepID=A0AAE3QJ01_9HYPH|nr:tyrosine-type recombinase/integrase [Fererhizobium litorale]MDI7924064.1 tyrosine-type recombinase/integrase [Fererhizobium litorale]